MSNVERFLKKPKRSLGWIVFVCTMPQLTTACFDASMSWKRSDQNFKLTYGTPLSAPLAPMVAGSQLPAVQVLVQDSHGNRVKDGTYTITLTPFLDSACTQSTSGSSQNHSQGTSSSNNNSDSSQFTAISQQGVATFSNLNSSSVGTYYLLASASSSDGITPVCSEAITFIPGLPDHITTPWGLNSSGSSSSSSSSSINRYFTGTVGAANTVSVQVVDQFNNPVQVSGIEVDFSVVSMGGGTGPDGNSSSSTDQNGIATWSYTSLASSEPLQVVQATPVGVTHMTPIDIPVLLTQGTVSNIQVSDFPLATVNSDFHWLRLALLDQHSNHASFQGKVNLASGGLCNPNCDTNVDLDCNQSVSFDGTENGEKWVQCSAGGSGLGQSISFSLPAPPPASTLTGSQTNINSQAPFCGAIATFNIVNGNWSSSTSWNPTYIPSIGNTAQSANILGGQTCNFDSVTSTPVNCVQNAGVFKLSSASSGLTIQGSQFSIILSGVLSDLGTSGLTFKPVLGTHPYSTAVHQTFSNNSSNPATLSRLVYTGSDFNSPFTLFGKGGFVLNSFNFSGVGGYSNTIYIDTWTQVQALMTIPTDFEVVVNPGGNLVALGGINVNGALTIRGGGIVQIGNGSWLEVAAGGGKLNLLGTKNALAAIKTVYSTDRFSFTIDPGAVLNAEHFYISNTDTHGLNLVSPSTPTGTNSQVMLNSGTFANIADGGTALTLSSSMTLNRGPYLSKLNFLDDSSRSGISAIDASRLSGQMGILNSQFGSPAQLRSHTYDPKGLILWDY